MKTMTCKQLGGACNTEFHASSFEEIGEMSQRHAMEMLQKGDPDHLEAMNKMKGMMENPEDMKIWMDNKKKEFEALPENE